MTATAINPATRAEVVAILVSLIDRDPSQPRFQENVDTELTPSFKAHGWFESEPCEVRPHPDNPDRFMLVDGERRLAGAKKAGLKEALCVITLEAEGEASSDVKGGGEADRLIRQIVHNSGKPLTPMEEAIAFKRIIDDRRKHGEKGYGPVQLSRDLGIAKSVATDRLAMMEIPSFWLPLIADGPLQTSHVPELHRGRKVPEKFQVRAFDQMKADYRWPRGRDYGRGAGKIDRLYVSDFKTLIRFYMHKFVRAVSDVPGYKGPTERGDFKPGYQSSAKVYAMDPAQWQPIFRKAIAARRKKTPKGESQHASTARADAAYQREERKRAIERSRWEKAEPAIVLAIANAVKELPAAACSGRGPLAEILIAEMLDGGRDLDVEDIEKRYIKRGATAEDLVRFIAVPLLVGDLSHDWGRKETLKRLKANGIKVDVEKIVAATQVDEEELDDDA